MKQKTYGIIISGISVLLLAVLVIQILAPMGNQQSAAKQDYATWVSGDYVGYSDFESDRIIEDESDALRAAEELCKSAESSETQESSSGVFGKNNEEYTLVTANVTEYDGETFYQFNQIYKDLIVYGRRASLAVDENHVLYLAADNLVPVSLENTTPSVNEETVEESIRARIGQEAGGIKMLEIRVVSSENLVIYNLGEDGENHLAYAGTLKYEAENAAGSMDVVVDAHNGEILSMVTNAYVGQEIVFEDTDNGDIYQITMNPEESSNRWIYYDDVRNLKLYNADGLLTKEYLEGEKQYHLYYENGKAIDVYREVLDNADVHRSSTKAPKFMDRLTVCYDFFQEVLGRTGYNNRNGELKVAFNCTKDAEGFNVPWNGLCTSYGDADGIYSMLKFYNENVGTYDGVGHEYMHAVEKSLSTMYYGNTESGGLCEGYSDVFGELIEAWRWNMDPDWVSYYQRTLYEKPWFSNCVYDYDDYKDGMDPHNSSTIVSHAMYNLWTSWDAKGMNIDERISNMAELMYRCLFLMQCDATFSEWRWAMEECANHMKDEGDLNIMEHTSVENALILVDIPMDKDDTEEQWLDAMLDIYIASVDLGTTEFSQEWAECVIREMIPYIDFARIQQEFHLTEEDMKIYLEENRIYLPEYIIEYIAMAIFGEERCKEINLDSIYEEHEYSDRPEYSLTYNTESASEKGWSISIVNESYDNKNMKLECRILDPYGAEHSAIYTFKKNYGDREGYGYFFKGYVLQSLYIPGISEEPEEIIAGDENTAGIDGFLEEKIGELVEKYGLIDIYSAEYFEDPNIEPGYMQQVMPEDDLKGLLTAEIYDYDGDGAEELLILRGDADYDQRLTNRATEVDWYLSMYEVVTYGQVSSAELQDEIQINSLGIPENTISSSIQLFRNGSTIGIDHYLNWNSQSYTGVYVNYNGSEFVLESGVEVTEWPNYAGVCNIDVAESLSALTTMGQRLVSGNREGWSEAYECSGVDAAEEYLDVLTMIYEDFGIGQKYSRSYYVSGGVSVQGIYAAAFKMPSELYDVYEGSITDLCGIQTGYAQGSMNYSNYDLTGLLDPYRAQIITYEDDEETTTITDSESEDSDANASSNSSANGFEDPYDVFVAYTTALGEQDVETLAGLMADEIIEYISVSSGMPADEFRIMLVEAYREEMIEYPDDIYMFGCDEELMLSQEELEEHYMDYGEYAPDAACRMHVNMYPGDESFYIYAGQYDGLWYMTP